MPVQSRLPATCLALHIGVWGEAEPGRAGGLLYRQLLEMAARMDVRGATAWNTIEGARPDGRFLSVENEVASNNLPVWLTMMDGPSSIQALVRKLGPQLRGQAVLCVEDVTWQKPAGVGEPMTESAQDFVSSGRAGLHVQVFMLERAKVDGKPVYQAIAELLRSHHVLWVSTMRGLAGFGEGRKVRSRSWFGQPEDVPITMHVVDAAEKLQPLLPLLTQLVDTLALVVASEVALYN